MKALLLAGGRGKRIGSLSESKNKCMIEINGKPIIEHNLDQISECKNYFSEIIIVVGYRAEDIINRYGIYYKGINIKYAIQKEQKGLVHAIDCAKDTIGTDDFFLFLADEIIQNNQNKNMLEYFKLNNLFGVCGTLIQNDNKEISKTYSVLTDTNNKILRLIEKPVNPTNNIQGTGRCVFKNKILSYIDKTPIHYKRNEKELPDLIQCAIYDENIIHTFNICDKYTNINSVEELKNCWS